MKLPITLDIPKYTCELPSSGQMIEFRPYVVKEEKLLLIANESNDPAQIAMTIKDVLTVCTFHQLDIASLPIFDIEYLYLMIRARSRGEEVHLNLKCSNLVDGQECGHTTDVVFNIIDHVTIKRSKDHRSKIMINDTVGVLMQYPNFTSMIPTEQHNDQKKNQINQIDAAFNQIAKCIDVIFTDQQEINASDYPFDEIIEFIENLTESQFKKLSQFLDTMPQIVGHVNFKCGKCGFKHKAIEVTGIQDFLN